MTRSHLAVLLAACATMSCIGNIGDRDEAGVTADDPEPTPGEGSSMLSTRRLTKSQIVNTLADVLGVDPAAAAKLAEIGTDPARYGEFTNEAARREGFTDTDVEALFYASYDAVAPLFEDPAARTALVGCEPNGATDPCIADYLARIGRLLFRRTLDDDELSRAVAVAEGSAADLGGDTWEGIAHATAALVQSPSFLYAPENGEPDPKSEGRLRYAGLEMATRLALALTNASPDDELLAAAEAGSLSDPSELEAQARRLVSSPRGTRGVVQGFFREYLELDKLEGLGKDPMAFPSWSSEVARSMRTEAELLMEDLLASEAPFSSVLVQRDTFVDGTLAAAYGIDWIEAGAPFSKVTIPDNWERVGLLGTGAVLALHADTQEPSPTFRGRFVRTKLLCRDIPPPPANVSTEVPPFDPDEPMTKRERLEAMHSVDPSCAGCHALMDPLGFPLDHFDAMGSFRTTENGLEIDASGSLDGASFDGAPEYAETLAATPDVSRCIAFQLFRYAAGRRETADEVGALDAIATGPKSVSELLVAITTSVPFSQLPLD